LSYLSGGWQRQLVADITITIAHQHRYELRLDGFVFLTSGSAVNIGGNQGHAQAGSISQASFTTVAVMWGGGDLIVNADSAFSTQDAVIVAVLDATTRTPLTGYGAADSLPFAGMNQTACIWSWGADHQTMSALVGKAVRFEVELTGGARLYSLRGRFAAIV
jgi:hypothetical protein